MHLWGVFSVAGNHGEGGRKEARKKGRTSLSAVEEDEEKKRVKRR